MRYQPQKRAVIIYGPPGSGKGTQAELLARKYGFIHFDTGRYIESIVHAPEAAKDPVLRREGKLFDDGKLCTPSWVLKIISEAITRIAKSGGSVVFSGSPRTVPEAFGWQYAEDETRIPSIGGLMGAITKLYGARAITVIRLTVRESSSLKRNSSRRVCSVCGLPVLGASAARRCSFCEGTLRTRTLDNPTVIKVRLKEYAKRTYPILAVLAKHGYKVKTVNGEPAPYKVHAKIVSVLGLK